MLCCGLFVWECVVMILDGFCRLIMVCGSG